jgi:hypothetical protein
LSAFEIAGATRGSRGQESGFGAVGPLSDAGIKVAECLGEVLALNRRQRLVVAVFADGKIADRI